MEVRRCEVKKYYELETGEQEASITIYGDITSYPWHDGDVSSYKLSKAIEGLGVETINLYINSYGGEVAEGLAIYNSLKRHKAKIKTYCDGFACSIASVIFMAGDERIMSNASLLMIHNPWTYTSGNAKELRKEAKDLEVIAQASVNAYLTSATITKDELEDMLDKETWLTAQDALDMGFATSIVGEQKTDKQSQSVKNRLIGMIIEKERLKTKEVKQKAVILPTPEPKEESNLLQLFKGLQ